MTDRRDVVAEQGGAGGVVEAIFVAPTFGGGPQPVDAVEAVPGRGLRGDRYWREDRPEVRQDACEATLIAAEGLDAVMREAGLDVDAGQHRRNLVVRGVDLGALTEGQRLRVGEVTLAFERPRPPCRYLERLTQEGMRTVLTGRAGVCARIVSGGRIARGDPVEVLAAQDAEADLQRGRGTAGHGQARGGFQEVPE